MGASGISRHELYELGIEIVEETAGGVRFLRIPGARIDAYRELVREKLEAGFWNEVVSRGEIAFVFKLADGTVRELRDSTETRSEIARLCSLLNDDPIEKTRDLLRYVASHPFYRDAMAEWYGVEPG